MTGPPHPSNLTRYHPHVLRRVLILQVLTRVLLGGLTTWLIAIALATMGPIGAMTTTHSLYRARNAQNDLNIVSAESRSFGMTTHVTTWPTTFAIVNGRPIITKRIITSDEPDSLTSLWDIRKGWGLTAKDYESRAFGTSTMKTQETATGWPVPAFWFAWDDHLGSGTTIGGFELPAFWPTPAAAGNAQHQAIPLRPISLGLAVNTLVFTALWTIILHIAPRKSARRRQREGLCPRCAYDLNGNTQDGCSECGFGKDVI